MVPVPYPIKAKLNFNKFEIKKISIPSIKDLPRLAFNIMNKSDEGRPIPLIVASEDPNDPAFAVPDEAAAALRKFDGPIAVIAVVGLYRTGKSYLVNRMVGKQHGFTVGPTVNACTKGIWMWSEPVPFVNARGEKLQLLVLDTEGIGGTKSSSDYDTRIFSLAVLLCSTLIYNSLGSIDEKAISNLSFVANLSQHVQVKASQGGDDESSTTSSDGTSASEGTMETTALSSFFPSFMWVIRDFALELVDEDYNDITEQDYLENCLKQQSGFSKDVLEKNRVRKSLTNFFTRRDCATIVRPLDDEAKLQQIDDEPYESLRQEFRDQLENMRNRVLGQLYAKTLQNKPLSGSMFLILTRTYVDAMNSDGVPTITTAWDHVAKTETKAAMKRAIEKFEIQLGEVVGDDFSNLPMDTQRLHEQQEKIKEDIIANFLAGAVGDAFEIYLPKLKLKIEELYADTCRNNENASLKMCTDLFIKLHSENILNCLPNAPNVAENDALITVQAVKNKFEKLQDNYFQNALGPKKDLVWQEKSTAASFTAYSAVLSWEKEKKDEEIRVALKRAHDAEQKLSTAVASEEILREELEETRKEGGSSEAQSSMLAIQLSGQKQEVTITKKRLEEAEEKLKLAKQKEDQLRLDYEKELEKIRLELKEEQEKEPIVPVQGGCGCVIA